MMIRYKLALSALLVFLVACSPRAAVSPVKPTQTIQPVTATIAALPSATATPTESASKASLALSIPRPLSGPAPWVMFPCAAPQANRAPTIANGDGTGCVPATLPSTIPADRAWISAAPRHGSYVAFRDTIVPSASAQQDAAYRLQQNGLDDQMMIVKLPENRVIRTIAQIDPDGWARLAEMWKNPAGQGSQTESPIPLPLAVILDPGAYGWSPNGRYLAYTGIDKIGVDMFVYDSETDTVRRMTRGRQGAFFWEWSPDGKWIVYHEMAGCNLANFRCQLEQGPTYFAVSFPAFPSPEYQFDNSFPAESIDWISNDHYILQDSPAQGQLHTHLVQVDLKYGTVAQLYNEPFSAYTYVPNTYATKEELYLLNVPAAPARDRVTGIYLLTPRTGELKPFHTDKYADYTAQWERTLERFILAKEVSGGSRPQKDVVLAPIQMAFPIQLGSLGSASFVVSPDENWFAAQLGTGSWGLFNAQGKLVKELGYGQPGQASPLTWLKKAGGFYFYAAEQTCSQGSGCILFFDKNKNWQPTRIGEIKAQPDVLQVIEP